MKKFLFFVIMILFGSVFCFADNSEQYHITSYDINIDVNQDKSLDVREVINLNFEKLSNGLIRDIPFDMYLTGNFKRTFSEFNPDFNIRIDDVRVVGLPLLVVRADGNTAIRLGDFENFLTGQKQVLLSYKVYGAINQSGDVNLLYRDLIGETLDTYSALTTFKINLSKSLDFGTNDFIIDYPQNNSGSEIKILSGSISGTVYDKIQSFRGLKIFLKIPDSYFHQSLRSKFSLFLQEHLVMVVIILFIIAVMMFGFWLSKDPDFDKGL